jgi:hypothetical protein
VISDEQARRYVQELELMRAVNPTAYQLTMQALAGYLEDQLEQTKDAEAALRALGEFGKADALAVRILEMEMVRDGGAPPKFSSWFSGDD